MPIPKRNFRIGSRSESVWKSVALGFVDIAATGFQHSRAPMEERGCVSETSSNAILPAIRGAFRNDLRVNKITRTIESPYTDRNFLNLKSRIDIPNEPIPASHPSEIPNLRSQIIGQASNETKLPNEATVEPENEEPRMKH
jgi:hypothetical protein